MLINATQAEEVRVAIVNGSVLDNLDTEILGKEQQKANVYKGKITRIEPSLEAVFVDYGGERHGFLPFREISRIYQKNQAEEQENTEPNQEGGEEGSTPRGKRPSLRDRFVEGQELIIQVEKEARGNKGAALTTYVSLAGCYLVLMPLNPTAGGISRRIDNDERAELREVLNQLNVPEGMGVIVRTAGVGRDIKDLQWDLDFLVQQWHAIEKASTEKPSPFLIYQESNVVVRAIRDHLRPEINEILVDSPKVYEEVNTYIRMMRPDYINRVKLYNDSIPLFSRFQIESQIENAMQREVRLPSGGSIVIDHTEALISIDINSAKATKGGDIEETALQTNLEAAEAIARQLRLRDIGGLVVIDFIDMNSTRNQRAVEQKLKEAMEVDRARVQIGKISSRFGLLEMSRQRLRPSLASSRDVVCPRCLGQGTIRGVEVLAINMIRLIEEEAIKDGTAQVVIEVPSEVATYLFNEKRQAILDIERKHHISVILLPSQHLETPNFVINRTKKDEATTGQVEAASYTLASKAEQTKYVYSNLAAAHKANAPAPAVSNINHSMAPQRKGILKRFISSILGSEQLQQPAKTSEPTKPATQHAHSPNYRGNVNKPRRQPQRTTRPPRANTQQRPHSQNASQSQNDEPRPSHSNAPRPPQQRTERGERLERTERHHERSERTEQRPDRAERTERPERSERQHHDQVQEQHPVEFRAEHGIAEAPFVQNEPNVQSDVVQNEPNGNISEGNEDSRNNNQQQRRRKQNRRRNHYRKSQGNPGNKEPREENAPSAATETKVSD